MTDGWMTIGKAGIPTPEPGFDIDYERLSVVNYDLENLKT
jgi:hypothetical protein